MTVPVPACPALGAKPGLVLTITIFGAFPVIVSPNSVIELETMTAMRLGIKLGGLAPVALVHRSPQWGGLLGVLLANPGNPREQCPH